MAPSFSHSGIIAVDKKILAMGAMLKSAFGLIHSGRYYISQYLGDTSTLESQISYEITLKHMMRLLSFRPSAIVVDAHPNYPSTLMGNGLAETYDTEFIKIQHHEAHSFAVLAENDLIDEDRILSVVWDGTGYGDDGQIWGGECFDYTDYDHLRIGRWEYYPHILGDKMSLEPRISALSLVKNIDDAEVILKNKFSINELKNYKKVMHAGRLMTSSVGRIFDAVSSLLDVADRNTYEGEAAMRLEAIAIRYLKVNSGFDALYNVYISGNGIISTFDLFSGIVKDRINGYEAGYIAAKFHLTLVYVIQKFLTRLNYQKVVFSGGVFQNNLLVDLIEKTLSDKYSVYFHKHLSPNDECIPFGQLIAYQVLKKNKT
jgi:hydrogenase maturation protein HypF